jgi:hypothetical protein
MSAFNSDPQVENEILKLKKLFNVETVIETGTYIGETTKFFCENFKDVYGIEISENYYTKTKDTCIEKNNLNLILNSSTNFLNDNLLEIGKDKEVILFYLDAHWDNYWPLKDEIDAISKNYFNRAIIVIDDFYVPNRDFQFDTYNDNVCNYDYIKNNIENCYDGFQYYFLNKTQRNLPIRNGNIGGVGKIFIIPNLLIKKNNIKNETIFFEERGSFYSTTE